MRWLLLDMYMDFLKMGGRCWDPDLREHYKMNGKSTPPIGLLYNQMWDVFVQLWLEGEYIRRTQ